MGIAIRGTLPLGPCTLLRIGGMSLERTWLARGEIVENLRRPDLCRTQVRVRVPSGLEEMFADPLGNHRILFLGDHLVDPGGPKPSSLPVEWFPALSQSVL